MISDNPIILDFSGCRYPDDIHERIKLAFGFPNYYGANWDALWDCLRDFALSESEKRTVKVKGVSTLPKELREYTGEAVAILKELQQNYPIVEVLVTEDA